jgi:predicted acetyltransferase
VLRCVIAEDGTGPRGYALYTGKQGWEEEAFLPASTVTVHELMADGPEASAALWADLLSRDLATTFRAGLRPADEPLLFQLADIRRAGARGGDGLWVRITDVPAALAGREYACPAEAVIEVRDEILPANARRWRLTTGGPGTASSCTATADPADLTVSIAQLGAAYLGGTRLGALAGAGLIEEHTPGAVRRLSAAMTWDPAPWCPTIF